MSDGTNTETLIYVLLTNEAVRFNHAVAGRFKGWRDGVLYYTVAGANSTGAITVGYIKNIKADSEPYNVWNSER